MDAKVLRAALVDVQRERGRVVAERDALRAEVERVTRDRDDARADMERMRSAMREWQVLSERADDREVATRAELAALRERVKEIPMLRDGWYELPPEQDDDDGRAWVYMRGVENCEHVQERNDTLTLDAYCGCPFHAYNMRDHVGAFMTLEQAMAAAVPPPDAALNPPPEPKREGCGCDDGRVGCPSCGGDNLRAIDGQEWCCDVCGDGDGTLPCPACGGKGVR